MDLAQLYFMDGPHAGEVYANREAPPTWEFMVRSVENYTELDPVEARAYEPKRLVYHLQRDASGRPKINKDYQYVYSCHFGRYIPRECA